jgi:AcrR family transcriptional regulator
MDEQGDIGVPASIAAAWGHARGRAGKRGLTLERICQAGVALADRDGLGAVSMARVAAEIGVSTMALYRHVASKDELLQLMADHAFGDPPPAGSPDEGWRDALTRWATEELARVRLHPWVVRIMYRSPPVTPNNIRWLEQSLRALGPTGLTEQEKLSTSLLISGYVVNWATVSIEVAEAAKASGLSPEQAYSDYGRRLARFIDPVQFPAVSIAIASGALDDEPDEFEDAEFYFGLARILDGVEALISARAAKP